MNEIMDWCSIFTRKAKVNNKSNILSLVWKPLPLSLRESPASEINLTLGSNFTRLELGFKNYMEFSLIIFLLHFSSSNIEAGTLSCSFGLKIPMEVNAIVSIDVQYLYIQIYLNMKIFLELILIISIDMR